MAYLDNAVKYLGVDKADVIKHRQEGDAYIVIVDKGIEGCPKYSIPLSELAEKQAPLFRPEPESEPEPEPEPDKDIFALDLNGMTVAELRSLAKDAGIAYSGLKKAELVAVLEGGE